jgi:hypothetical protein
VDNGERGIAERLGGGRQEDPIEELVVYLTPVVTGVLERLEGDEFTTAQFVEVLLSDPEAAVNYEAALKRWGESEHYAKMVVHGQVIPAILRRSPLVEWAGYAHGEEDEYAVPAWWRLRPASEG